MTDRFPFQPARIALPVLALILSLAVAQQPCTGSGYDALES